MAFLMKYRNSNIKPVEHGSLRVQKNILPGSFWKQPRSMSKTKCMAWIQYNFLLQTFPSTSLSIINYYSWNKSALKFYDSKWQALLYLKKLKWYIFWIEKETGGQGNRGKLRIGKFMSQFLGLADYWDFSQVQQGAFQSCF